jgi:hypothetical protein
MIRSVCNRFKALIASMYLARVFFIFIHCTLLNNSSRKKVKQFASSHELNIHFRSTDTAKIIIVITHSSKIITLCITIITLTRSVAQFMAV